MRVDAAAGSAVATILDRQLQRERVSVRTVYEIGPFRLDIEAGVLSHSGLPVALGVRGVAVLTTLVARSNEYV